MSSSVIRGLSFSKLLPCRRSLLANPLPKTLFSVKQNTRSLTRSMHFLNGNRISHSIPNLSLSKTCSCSAHTKGDTELAAYLMEEIQNEKTTLKTADVAMLDGFSCDFTGAEVSLTKKMENETITIKANVNNSVDTEETVMDPNETQEQEGEMKSKPEFTIEIKKGSKILSFHCTFTSLDMEAEDEAGGQQHYNDSFEISEVSMYDGEFTDATYVVSGEIMDGYLYDLLMNYLEDRGISNSFADKMITFFTSYEHQLYIKLLQGIKSFVEK